MASTLKNIMEGIAGAGVIKASLLTPFLRGWRATWGATPEELAEKLPGDEFIPHPKWQYTNAISVGAPAAEVWPWLVQMGQGRGGLYSYDWLENLVGCDIHSADRILSEFQSLAVGDGIRLHPQMPGYPVAIIEPEPVSILYAKWNSSASTPLTFQISAPEAVMV